jgi:ElaB/YqjD/DUF883 family membrane-anchored ribosome-binding protein
MYSTVPDTRRETGGYGYSSSSQGELSSQCQSFVDHLKQFCQENPGTAAAWCFGIGFVLGWRLKPW